MGQMNSALVDDLRRLFEELRSVASDGLSALGPPGCGNADLDQKALEETNAKLRRVALLILAAQDAETR